MINTAYNMGETEGMVDSPEAHSAAAAAVAAEAEAEAEAVAGRPRTCGTEVQLNRPTRSSHLTERGRHGVSGCTF